MAVPVHVGLIPVIAVVGGGWVGHDGCVLAVPKVKSAMIGSVGLSLGLVSARAPEGAALRGPRRVQARVCRQNMPGRRRTSADTRSTRPGRDDGHEEPFREQTWTGSFIRSGKCEGACFICVVAPVRGEKHPMCAQQVHRGGVRRSRAFV